MKTAILLKQQKPAKTHSEEKNPERKFQKQKNRTQEVTVLFSSASFPANLQIYNDICSIFAGTFSAEFFSQLLIFIEDSLSVLSQHQIQFMNQIFSG